MSRRVTVAGIGEPAMKYRMHRWMARALAYTRAALQALARLA